MKMKYILYCALIALAVFSAPASADYNIVGDVNNDGRITTADSLLALQMSVGSIAPDPESADVNGDGRVNSLDALMILAMVQTTQVCVNAPEVVSGAFDVTIDIYNVVDLDSGQFDLSFDSSVVNVTGVCDGNIDGATVPVDSWSFADADTIRVLFNLPGTTGVSGSGQIATISFEITGAAKDTSVLDISDGLLVDSKSNETSALWNDCEVAIGVPVTVNAPEVATDAFNATIEIENVVSMNGGQFDLSFDSSVVNVTGVYDGSIDGTAVPLVDWRFMDSDTIRVLFKLSGADAVSGSGSVTTIGFAITGSQGDISVLDISDGLLVDINADEIPATWTDDEVSTGVAVTVNAPEVATDAFNATIEIENVVSMNGGQFDLSFDSSVVNVTDVSAGSIDGTTVPLLNWTFMDSDTIRVLFKLAGADGVSGSGYVTKIDFEITGSQGDTSVLDISDGNLADTNADEIPATWADASVSIGVPVTVNAPEVATGAFTATIEIENVASMNGGQFDLSFDSSVVNVTDVSAGSIDGTTVPLLNWTFMDSDTIRVLFKLAGADGVSGSGYVTKIDFEITGSQGDTSVLDISDGNLADTNADEIPATWADASVSTGVAVTVNAPEVVSGAFDATVDIENVVDMNGGQFDLSFDSSVVNVVDVSAGSIDGTTVPLVDWRLMDADTVRVLFKLSGVNGASGSGSVATIEFAVTGSSGDTSVLDIFDGALSDINADEIPAVWIDDEVTV